jgi:hypothetical protein
MVRPRRSRCASRVDAEPGSKFDWRDGGAYAPLIGADRSLFAWEWLRRDPFYRAAAASAFARSSERRENPAAAAFGLVSFERPERAVPHGRPLWRSSSWPQVLPAERGGRGSPEDRFDLRRLSGLATLVAGAASDYLLLSDGWRAIRLDGPRGAFREEPVQLRYLVEGLASAEPRLVTLRRFLALCRCGRFSRSLHSLESRARRWILMLRAWDALVAGADQRQIAQALLSRSVSQAGWRSREPSVRSQAQRLVRSARVYAAGGYRGLLTGRVESLPLGAAGSSVFV